MHEIEPVANDLEQEIPVCPEIEDAATSETRRPAPQIWVGSWLDYNSGRLHGDWIDANQTTDALQNAVTELLARSPTAAATGEPAEDWGIFDFDGFGALRIGEQESLEWVSRVATGVVEHGSAFAAYADVVQDIDALAGFEDDYLGLFESVEAYAESFTEDAGYNRLLDEALPDCIRAYVRLDTAAIARDMQAGGDLHVIAAEDGVYLFASR